jgi:magnesium chelatase accessory protein
VLLLLHGTGATTHSWRDLLPLLAEHFDVIAPDLPGHGFTRVQNRRQCALPAMAEEVTALLQQLETAPDLLVGHSAGAAISIHCALHDLLSPRMIIGLNAALTPFRGVAGTVFPPLAKALALNPFVPWMFSSMASGSQVQRMIDGTGSKIDARGMELYVRMIGRSEHVDGALSMMALWELDPLLAALPEINIPVHLVVGDADQTVPPDEVVRLAEQISAVHLTKVPDLGHLMHEEDPHRFARLILDLSSA